MNTEELKSFIEEEQRCLDYCINNPDECEDGEIEERERDIAILIEKLKHHEDSK